MFSREQSASSQNPSWKQRLGDVKIACLNGQWRTYHPTTWVTYFQSIIPGQETQLISMHHSDPQSSDVQFQLYSICTSRLVSCPAPPTSPAKVTLPLVVSFEKGRRVQLKTLLLSSSTSFPMSSHHSHPHSLLSLTLLHDIFGLRMLAQAK